jgi:hypothetical protein
MEGLFLSHLCSKLPFKIVRHPFKGLIFMSKKSLQKRDFDKIYGYAQWVDLSIIARHEKAFEKHDSKMEDEQGRRYVVVGMIAIVSHGCKSPWEFSMSKELVETVKSPAEQILITCFLDIQSVEGKWNLPKDTEITVWYGKDGVENCRCGNCGLIEEGRMD